MLFLEINFFATAILRSSGALSGDLLRHAFGEFRARRTVYTHYRDPIEGDPID